MKNDNISIRRNRAKCLICKDILESKTVHDFQTCKCGNLSVDGGNEYLKRSAINFIEYKELSDVKILDSSDITNKVQKIHKKSKVRKNDKRSKNDTNM